MLLEDNQTIESEEPDEISTYITGYYFITFDKEEDISAFHPLVCALMDHLEGFSHIQDAYIIRYYI